MSEVHKLEVVIEGSDAKLKQAVRDATQSTKRMTEAINSELKKIKSPAEALRNDKSGKEWQNTVNFLRKSFEDMRNMTIPKELRNSIKNYAKEAQLAAGLKVYTDDYLIMKKDADSANDALRRLRLEEEALRESGASEGLSEPYRKAKKAADEAEKSLDKILKKQGELEKSGKAYEDTAKAKKLYAAEKEAQKNYDTLYAEAKERMTKKQPLSYIKEDGAEFKYGDELVKLRAALTKIRAEIQELNRAGKDVQPTEAMRKLTEQADAASDKLGKCKDAMTELSAKGAMTGNSEWIKNQQNIEKYRQQAEAAEKIMSRMESSGKDVQFTGGLANQSFGASAEASIKQTIARIKEANARVAEAISKIPVVGRVASEAAYIGSKAFGGMRAVMGKVSSVIKTTGGAFASLIQKFRSGLPHIIGARDSMRRMGDTGRGVGGILRTLGTTVKFMAASFAITGSINAAKTGLRNLAQYSQTTNANLSTLRSGLTQLQNSFATAFAPVLNVVTPILSTLIDYLVAAASAVAQFMAALTGQGAYTVAKRVATDYAAGLNSAGAAANGANEAAKDLKKTLMGFDQINKLDDDSSSGGSGGSGGGGGGAGIGDMFETETVTNQFADFAEKIKRAWADADFTEIGGIIGAKLKEGLDNIPWDGIKETAQKIGKSVATLINGFVETSGLGTSVGNTVAEAINTGVLGANAFLANLHWESVGQFVADSMNGFIATADWAGAGDAVRNGVNGVFSMAATWSEKFDFSAAGDAIKTALNSALSGIKWENAITAASNIGTGIATALNNVITSDTLSNVGQTIANALNTVVAGASSFIDAAEWNRWGVAIGHGFQELFTTFDWKGAIGNLVSLTSGIFEAITYAVGSVNWFDIGKTLADAITSADWGSLILNAIAAALVITASLTETLISFGANLIAGLCNGIINAIADIGSWIKANIVDPIVNAVKNFFGIHSPSTVFMELGKFLVEGLLEGLKNIPGTLEDILKGVWDSIKSAWEGLGAVLEAGVSLAKKGWETVSGWLSGLGDAVKGTLEAEVSLAKKGWSSLKNFVGDTVEATVSLAKSGWSSLESFVGDAVEVGIRLFRDGWDTLKGWIGDAKDTILEIGVRIKDKATDLWNGLKNAWDTGVDKVFEIGVNIVNTAADWWEDVCGWWEKETKNKSLEAYVKANPGSMGEGAETPEGEAGETDSSGGLPLQVIHGKLVVDEIDLPNETDPNRPSVGVKATVSELIIPDTIKRLSGLSAVLTGGISPVTGTVLTGIGAVISTVSKATGINDLPDLAASIANVWKSGNPVVEGLSGTVASTSTQEGASLRVTNVAAKVVMADWMEKADTSLKGVMAEIKAKSISDNGKSVTAAIKAKKFSDNGKSVTTAIKAKKFSNNGKSVTTTIKAKQINNNGKSVTTTVYANAIKKASNFAGLALSAVAKIVSGAISLVFKADGGVYKNGSWRPITAAANGGAFSTGQMFVAREAGPELVGTIGRSTAVMNNNQIVSSVAAGVYQAVVAAMAASGGGQKSRPVFNIYVGGKKITDVVIEEVNNRTISTGQCPILT